MSFFSRLFKKESDDWFFAQLPAEKTLDNFPVRPVKTEEEYISIILKSMRIVNIRIGFSKFYATVHSYISLSHASGTRASFYVSTTAGKLEELDKSNIDKVINFNKRLLGPIPYLGGDVNMELGLFSIKSVDLIKPFISLLSEISNLASVSFVKVAEPYLRPLETGINLLLGSDNPTVLETGISTSYISSIETGYYVSMCAPKSKIKKEDLIIDKQDFKLLDRQGKPIVDYPYLVFQIIADKKRDDWREIPDIKLAHEKLKAEAKAKKIDDANEAWAVFKRTVQFSDDMIESDKDRLIKEVKDDLDKKLGTTLTAKGPEILLKDLEEIDIYSKI